MSNPAFEFERDALAAARLAAEVRGFLADAPADDPEVAKVLADAEAVDRLARWACRPPVKLTGLRTGA